MLVWLIVVAMVVVTVWVAAFVLAPRIGEGRLVFEPQPDLPHAFGCGMSWLAIRTRDTQRVIDTLSISDGQTANWSNGLGTVYSPEHGQGMLFVSPAVNGWTFVVGLALPQPLGKAFADKATPLLVDLGAAFIEVQYFCSCPDVDHFAWARIIDGKLIRAFAISDEGIVWNKGKPTKDEKALGLKLFEVRGVRGKRGDIGGELVIYPTEGHVMHLAAKWSIDPTRVTAVKAAPGFGLVGRAPLAWRPERLRRSA